MKTILAIMLLGVGFASHVESSSSNLIHNDDGTCTVPTPSPKNTPQNSPRNDDSK